MADLSPPHQPPPPPTSSANFAAIDSDDISSLLHTLLQSSSQQHGQQPRQFPGSSGFHDNSGLLDPSFAYPGPYYGSGALSVDGVDDGDADFHSEEDLRGKSASGRNSSKRSRAAEVHNMSEKRRRQRINEKMKALQKLIPNSNKTDKASMLDEAIEYLKQLQLQVQMLTFKNGSSSHPYYLQPAMQLPSVGPLDEGNSSRAGSFTADQEASMQAMLNLSSKPASCDYKLLMARMSENNTSGQAYAPQSSMNLHYRPLNDSMPSKVLCKDPVLPQLQLDMSQYGQSSSSGVSS